MRIAALPRFPTLEPGTKTLPPEIDVFAFPATHRHSSDAVLRRSTHLDPRPGSAAARVVAAPRLRQHVVPLRPAPFDDSPGWHRGAIEHDNQNRAFKYYVPSDLSGDAPVVMALHGATIGMDGMFARSRPGSREWLEIADEEGILILVPDASHDVQPVWNDCTPLPNRGTPDDAGFLATLTDWTTSRADVDADIIFIYGVSNGGQMANRLAIEHPDRYAGFAAFISNVTASLGDDEECPMPSVPIPALIVSGRNDPTTPFDGGFAPDWGDTLLSAPATRDFWVNTQRCKV